MNIGILLQSLGASQLAFQAISQGNAINLNSIGDSVVLFYQDITMPCSKFAGTATSSDKAFHTDCYLLSTNLRTAKLSLSTYSDKRKYFYMSDIEWLYNSFDYLENIRILTDTRLDIIVPSQEYADELYNYCGRKAVAIVPDFNISLMLEEMKKHEIRSREQ